MKISAAVSYSTRQELRDEVDIAPAFGEITTACNVGQAKKWVMVCACKVSFSQPSLLQRYALLILDLT